jgi:hypothetical protein
VAGPLLHLIQLALLLAAVTLGKAAVFNGSLWPCAAVRNFSARIAAVEPNRPAGFPGNRFRLQSILVTNEED